MTAQPPTDSPDSPDDFHLAPDDARAIVRLLGEVAILPGDTSAKRLHLMQGLLRLTHTYWWAWAHVHGLRSPTGVSAFAFLHHPFPSPETERAVISGSYDRDNVFPEFAALAKIPFHHQTFTRQDLISDHVAQTSPTWNLYRQPANFDHSLFAVYPIAEPDTWSLMAFHRQKGQRPYSPRDRFFVHLITSEIDWLHKADLQIAARPVIASLTPRQREVVHFLLLGHNPKQIARLMNLSPHTVTDHMKAIYKHFNCSSRGEFFTRFRAGGQSPNPA